MSNLGYFVVGLSLLAGYLVAMAAVLFGAAGTLAVPMFWAYLVLFAVLCLSRLHLAGQQMRGVIRCIAKSDDSRGVNMAGKSLLTASEEQRVALRSLAESRDRGEADRARAVLLTLAGWTSPRIAEAFGVREDTVRLWRSDFVRGGVEALRAKVAPGPAPVKSEAALRAVTPLLEQPVADRRNWTIPRLQVEIEAREGVRISRSQLSKALRKKSSAGAGRGTR